MRTFQRVSRFIRPAVVMPVLVALALGGFLALVLGCDGQSGREPPAMTAPAINPRLPDVPVPFGFKFNTARSFDRAKGESRTAEHLYEGDAPLRQVAEFYRHQMPTFGWTQKEENFSNGVQRFTFEKGGDICYVSIWDNWGTKVLIKVLPQAGKRIETGARPAARPAGR